MQITNRDYWLYALWCRLRWCSLEAISAHEQRREFCSRPSVIRIANIRRARSASFPACI